MQCETCFGRGWFLSDGDETGAHIKRCEKCNAYTTDDAVVRAVAGYAILWERYVDEIQRTEAEARKAEDTKALGKHLAHLKSQRG